MLLYLNEEQSNKSSASNKYVLVLFMKGFKFNLNFHFSGQFTNMIEQMVIAPYWYAISWYVIQNYVNP